MARLRSAHPLHQRRNKCDNCVCPRFVDKYDKILHRALELRDKGVISTETMYYIMLVEDLGKVEKHESN